MRLIYAIAFGDKRFLPNTICSFIQEKGIYMTQKKTSNNTKLISYNSTTININSQSSLQELDSSYSSSIENVDCLADDNSKINKTSNSNE